MSAAIRGTVTDAIPRLAIRMDDGTRGEYEDAIEFLKLGIPVTLAVNFDNLKDTGPINPYPSTTPSIGLNSRMSKAQIRELIRIAKDHGTELELAQHSNTNWSGFTQAKTYEEIRAELSTTNIVDEFDQPVRVYVQPGGTIRDTYVGKELGSINQALRDEGLQFAIGLFDTPAGSDRQDINMAAPLGMLSSAMDHNSPTDSTGGFQNTTGMRPGILDDPYVFPDAATVDIGTLVLPRGVENGSNPPLPDLNSGAIGWLLGEDNTGAGTCGAAAGDWDKTIQFRIFGALAGNMSLQLAFHGEKRSNDTVYTSLSTGQGAGGEKLPNSMSARHMASLIKRLWLAGHIIPVTLFDWCSYIYSDYADGVDLIGNDNLGIPMFDADERIDALGDMPWPRGMGMPHVGQNSFPPTASGNIHNSMAAPTGMRYASPLDVKAIIGADVAGIRGRAGGMILRANDDADYGTLNFRSPYLAPGRYRFRFDASNYTTGAFRFSELSVYGTRLYRLTEQNLATQGDYQAEALYLPVFADGGQFKQLNVLDQPAGLMHFELYFDCPRDGDPWVTKRISVDSGSIADGATAVVGGGPHTITHPDLQPGNEIRCWTDEALPDGVWITGEITERNGTTNQAVLVVTIHNESGSAFDPGSVAHSVWCKLDRLRRPMLSSPMGPWIYQLTAQVAKDTATAATLGNFHLDYLARL